MIEVWHQSPSRHYFGDSFTEQVTPEGCPVCDSRRRYERIESTCEAMSRFCVWWFAEPEATAWANRDEDEDLPGTVEASFADRSLGLGEAARLGLIRIDWRRP